MERLKVETNSEVKKKKKKRNIFSIEQSQLSTTKRKVKNVKYPSLDLFSRYGSSNSLKVNS